MCTRSKTISKDAFISVQNCCFKKFFSVILGQSFLNRIKRAKFGDHEQITAEAFWIDLGTFSRVNPPVSSISNQKMAYVNRKNVNRGRLMLPALFINFPFTRQLSLAFRSFVFQSGCICPWVPGYGIPSEVPPRFRVCLGQAYAGREDLCTAKSRVLIVIKVGYSNCQD